MQVRPFERADAERLAEMVRGLAAHHGDEALIDAETLRALCAGDEPWCWTLVAEEAGSLIGYASLIRTAQLQFGVRGMDLHHFFVCPEQRGKGLGAQLLKAAEEAARARGARYLVVGTDAGNGAAQDFYLSQGFARRQGAGARFSKRL